MEKVPEKDLISRYGEYGRIIGFQVINSEMPEEEQLLSFDGLTKATFTLHKPDGNLYIEDLDITTYSEDNVAVIALNEQMTAAEGKAHYDITLTYEDAEDGFRIITAHGNMVIDTPMAGTEEINSTSVIYGLIFPDDFQLKLTAGENITISEDNVISATGGGGHAEYIAGEGIRISGNTISLTTVVLNQLAQIVNKQNKLTAGANITINSSNVISATDTTYTAGTGISISSGVIRNTAPGITYTAGDNISIEGTEISATDTTYTAGSGIAISAENVISATGGGGGSYVAGTGIDITGDTISLNSATQNTLSAVAGKQDALTAGSNISISGTTISATDTTYTAGTNVSISAGNVISATDTTYAAGTGLSLSSGEFSLSTATQNSLAKTENIGAPDTYDPDHEYNVGEACEHDGLWYRSLYGYSGMGPGPWDATKWERTDSWTEIDDLNQNLTELKNNVAGSQISLESYTTAANKYTFTNDGYIYINSGSATSSTIRIVIADATGSAIITKYLPLSSGVIRDSVYVRKGMAVYCDNIPTGATVKFVPLISYQ